uniref:Poly(3-hydroxyalkanoate) polymerase subunit PhaE n=2 Tax=Geoglobus ahangari TaxID=113653 RepID=A0A7C4WDN0_9EURY
MIADEELIELFKTIPKESFELILRNIKIKRLLENLYNKHRDGLELTYNEQFDEIFEEMFRFFFRPLEMAISGAKMLESLFILSKPLNFTKIQSELLDSYLELMKSLYDHMRLTWEIWLGLAPKDLENPAEKFIDLYSERIKNYRREFTETELPVEILFVFPKKVFERFENAIESWSEFSSFFKRFRELVKDAYTKGVESFIKIANSNRFENYNDFVSTFFSEEAKVFDELLVSKEYLETQKNMLKNLMDYIYNYRMFFEEIAMSNPLNPFATISLLDKAFERIYDLRRKIRELEKRVEKLERGENADRKD